MTRIMGLLVLLAAAAVPAGADVAWTEDFSTDPAARGWAYSGKTPDLAGWDGAGALDVTWDASADTSFYRRDLGITLDGDQDFAFSCSIKLDACSISPDMFWEVSLGLYDSSVETDPLFDRGYVSGYAFGLLEWDFFPNEVNEGWVGMTGFDAAGGYFGVWNPYIAWNFDAVYGIDVTYDAMSRTLYTAMTVDGATLASFDPISLAGGAWSFDRFGVMSYGAAGTADLYATGWVDNVAFSASQVPEPATALLLGCAIAALAPLARRRS